MEFDLFRGLKTWVDPGIGSDAFGLRELACVRTSVVALVDNRCVLAGL